MNQSATSAAGLAPGRVIGGCRVIEEVKRGGMGCVHRAEHLALEREVAVKTILPFKDDDASRRMFFREAKLLAKVQHPNVVVIHDTGEDRGVPFIVMQFVEGKNLAEYLKEQRGPLPWQTVLRVMRLAVGGLAAVHRRGLVHRDIKPSNIMVSVEGRVLLMDFGLVRDTADAAPNSTGIMGTPDYMSPEQCEGQDLDARSDLFSIGSTLYELLTNVRPFGGGKHAATLSKIIMREAPPPVRALNPAVPVEVSDLVARAMRFDRDERFQSADELRHAIGIVLSRLGATAGPNPASAVPGAETAQSLGGLAPELAVLELVLDDPSGPVRWFKGPRWLLPAAGVLAACVLLAVLALVLGAPPEPAADAGPSHANMVEIAAGDARLGVSVDRVVRFWKGLLDTYGSTTASANKFQEPEVTVPVPRFWIDRYEVTNREYLEFVTENDVTPPPGWVGGHPGSENLDLPVTNVTFAEAQAYARWRKKKLPTSAQWMRAFHGDSDTLFPWGDEFLPDLARVEESVKRKGIKQVGPVADTPDDRSQFGVRNLVGNVSEITRDTTDLNGIKVVFLKGGNGGQPGRIYGIGGIRDPVPVDTRHPLTGFRCVDEAPETKTQ